MIKKLSFLSLLSLLGVNKKPTTSLRLGSRLVFISDPALIRQAVGYEKTGQLSRQAFTRFVTAPILGDDVFSSSEQEWRRHKEVLSRGLRPTSSTIALWRRCAREATNRALEQASGPGVNGEQFCRKIVQDSLVTIFFGRKDAVDERVFHLAHQMDVCAEFATFSLLAFGRPISTLLAQPFWLLGNKYRRNLERLLNQSRPEPRSPAADPAFRREMRSLLFAGQDTTTVALCLLLWLLANHPARQLLIHRQVLEHGGDSTLLHQAVLETLRLFPPVHTLPARTTMETVKLGDIPISQGTEVIYSLWYAHRRCDRAEEFLPERHPNGKYSRQFMPFGAGPKRCVGERLAMAIITEAASEILKRNRITCKQSLYLGSRTTLRPNKLVFNFEEVSNDH